MKSLLALVLACSAIASAALLTPSAHSQTTHVSLTILDRDSGISMPGVVRIRKTDGGSLLPAGLISARLGPRWCHTDQRVARCDGRYHRLTPSKTHDRSDRRSRDRADFHRSRLDERDRAQSEDTRLATWAAPTAKWFSANTHLHLRNFTQQEADRYLREIPAVDRLDTLFISHLERAEDDRSYVTNQYPPGRLTIWNPPASCFRTGKNTATISVLRAKVSAMSCYWELRELLVRRLASASGSPRSTPIGRPIRSGIDRAHERYTAIWCHNDWGFEDVPKLVGRATNAQNIFDGGSHGSYEDSFYHYLNAGIRIPFSTGTDWFMYDFSRCYAWFQAN